MTVVLYVSGHGFGHAAREIEVIRGLTRRRPDLRVVVRTSVPAWFFGLPGIEVQFAEVDTGVVQVDSLVIDAEATARLAAGFYQTFASRAVAEGEFLRKLGASLVIGDVPPLAFTAARHAGVRSILLGNFCWDAIYAVFPEFQTHAPDVIETIRRAYSDADLALRLPFSADLMTPRTTVRDVELIARKAPLDRNEARTRLEIGGEVVVLASFGRYGVSLPYESIARDNLFTLVLTEHETAAASTSGTASRYRRLTDHDMRARGLEYHDLIAAADIVVSKPGYGIVSGCIANGASLLYTSRGHFPEYDVFVREMPQVLRCREILQRHLREGRWSDGVEALLQQNEPPKRMVVDGAESVAAIIMEYLG